MNVCVVGPGYVGLVSAAGFAEMGHKVWSVGRRAEHVEALSRGEIPIYEPGLDELILRNIRGKRLRFTTDMERAISECLFVFICVGTPPRDDGSSDLSAVYQVAETIGNVMTAYKVIVNKSTVPVGTADTVREIVAARLAARGADLDFDVVSNPEFLKEGDAVGDFMKPDRIVVGTSSDRAAEHMRTLYAGFSRLRDKLIMMDVRSSEMTKYAANCMLAAKISFINEVANICELVGADVSCVRRGIGSDPRIGYHFIYPGAGYGGSCFPKDVKALISTALQSGYTPELLQAVENVNARQKSVLFRKIRSHFQGNPAGKTLAVWGLAFKPNTDDVREAPAFTLIREAAAQGMRIRAYDPIAGERARAEFADNALVEILGDRDEVLEGADALAVVTEWPEFRNPDFALVAQSLAEPVIFDGRNLYDLGIMEASGFTYYGIGRFIAPGGRACGCDES